MRWKIPGCREGFGRRVEQGEFEQLWGRDLLQPPAPAREVPHAGDSHPLPLPREGTRVWGHGSGSGDGDSHPWVTGRLIHG